MVKNFDLTGWVCFSDRRNSKSYVSSDKKWMVKFDTEVTKRNEKELEKEREISLKALEVGIKTPNVRDVVETKDGTLGLIYEYIEGKKSLARCLGDDIENLDKYMEKFAKAGKDFHSKICDTKKFDSKVERIRENINMYKDLLNDRQLKAALDLLDSLEVKNTCLHGDFHMGNFITTGSDEFAIDLSSLAYGNPIWDVTFLYYFIHYLPDVVVENVLHFKSDLRETIWKTFVKYYYGITDEKELLDLANKFNKICMVSFFQNIDHVKPGPEFKDNIDKYFDKFFGL